MKKLLALTLVLALALGMVACGAAETPDAAPADGNNAEVEAYKLPGDVEYVVPYSAGGGSDLYSRTCANIMTEMGLLGNRAVTVNNKPGGSGAVGDAYTATKKGDGTTITAYVSAQITTPIISGSGITYEEMTPICNLALDEYTIGVKATAEYKTIEEFIAYAKANPGKITVGGSGSGTEDNLVTGLMQMYCGIEVEYIPHDSSSEVMTGLLGEHLDAGIFNPNEALAQYEAGEVLLLAAFGAERISVLPDVPTFTEKGYEECRFQQFRGVFGPPNMDPEAVAFWVDVYSQVITHEDWTEGYLAKNGLTSYFIYGEEYAEFCKAEAAKYQAVLDTLGLSNNK